MDKESRNAFIVIGAAVVGFVAVGVVFSGRSSDAIYTGPPIAEQYQVADAEAVAEEVAEAPVEEAPAEEVAEAPAEEAPAEEVAEAPAEEAPAEEVAEEAPAEVAEAPAEEAPAEEVAEAPAEEAPVEVALAGDPAAGERVWRQCQACHQIGDGAQNRVGPHLNDIIDRPKAAVEGFRYSNALQALGNEGGIWTVEELHGFLANPRGYLPGTTMAFAGLRNPDDIDDLIAYLATYE
jgi:cytochrome c2